MKVRRSKWFAILMILAMIFSLAPANVWAQIETQNQTYYNWEGYPQGLDSKDCSKAGEDGRPDDGSGWIHWLFNNKGESTDATLYLFDKSDSSIIIHESKPWPSSSANWHFYTPYYELETLGAYVMLFGGDGSTPKKLIISDWCPGDREKLEVTKTAVTSYDRTHDWDIEKWVETEFGHKVDEDIPKIWLYVDGRGDEEATWKVKVIYEGYEDHDFLLSGEVKIKNTGKLDAKITEISDKIGDKPIELYFDNEYKNLVSSYPISLEAGKELILYYRHEGKIEGTNKVEVTTEKDKYYGEAKIIWGEPENEFNKLVKVFDESKDLWREGVKELGILDASDYKKGEFELFEYDKFFKYVDFAECGSVIYENVASVKGGELFDVLIAKDEAILKVNVQCLVYDSAWAQGNQATSFRDLGFSNWGWTNKISPGIHYFDLYAGAGQSIIEKGELVGKVEIIYESGKIEVKFMLNDDVSLGKWHVYAGKEMLPKLRNGRDTVAPGSYSIAKTLSGDIYVIIHAEVGYADPKFGPK